MWPSTLQENVTHARRAIVSSQMRKTNAIGKCWPTTEQPGAVQLAMLQDVQHGKYMHETHTQTHRTAYSVKKSKTVAF